MNDRDSLLVRLEAQRDRLLAAARAITDAAANRDLTADESLRLDGYLDDLAAVEGHLDRLRPRPATLTGTTSSFAHVEVAAR